MDKVKQHTAPSQTQKILCRYCPAGTKPILVKTTNDILSITTKIKIQVT